MGAALAIGLGLPMPWQSMHQGQTWQTSYQGRVWTCAVTRKSDSGLSWLCNPSQNAPQAPSEGLSPQNGTAVPLVPVRASLPNPGWPGSCVWYVFQVRPDLRGIPKYPYAAEMALAAHQGGFTVSNVARLHSVAVFQPGIQGANSMAGHVALVVAIRGGYFLVAGMAQPYSWQVTYVWHQTGYGVSFIY